MQFPKLRMTAFVGILLLAIEAGPADAQEPPLSDAQEDRVRALVRDYLLENPEVIREAIEILRARDEADRRASLTTALSAHRGALERASGDPVGGNPDGAITVVEFFDYNCGYCKKVMPDVMTLIEENSDVRYVFKEFPVLAPSSRDAARIALAIYQSQPELYQPFHKGLLELRGRLSKERALDVAEEVGVDLRLLDQALGDPAVDELIERNLKIAAALGINGTPTFVIGDQILPGAAPLSLLQSAVEKARQR